MELALVILSGVELENKFRQTRTSGAPELAMDGQSEGLNLFTYGTELSITQPTESEFPVYIYPISTPKDPKG